MEAKYVHKPAVAPEATTSVPPEPALPEAPELPEVPALPERSAKPEAAVDRTDIVQLIESRIRAHPMYALAGGFILGILLGIVVRR